MLSIHLRPLQGVRDDEINRNKELIESRIDRSMVEQISEGLELAGVCHFGL